MAIHYETLRRNMCGVAGMYCFTGNRVAADLIRAMATSLEHRGPDNRDVWSSGHVGLAHTRLSILDLDQSANQPMFSRDKKAVLVFNGEIYNHSQIRDELCGRGVECRTRSDTEVIVEGYRQWGCDVFVRLNGMFAAAIVDRDRDELIIVRDRFGIKPLFYHANDSHLLFGSEIKALLATGLVDRHIETAALAEYLYYSTSLGKRTFFKGVKRLAPGEMLVVNKDGFRFETFATAIPVERRNDGLEGASTKVKALLEESVKRQMVADVPIGVFLSGGIDSSAIASFASRYANGPLETYSAEFAFSDQGSELAMARHVAHGIGANHHELRIEPEDLVDTLGTLVRAHDQPFGDPANIPLELLCEQLNGNPKVILQGDGGDEVFGGYPRYARLARQRYYQWLAAIALPAGGLFPKASKAYRALRSLHAMGQASDDMRMALIMSQEPYQSAPDRMLGRSLREQLQDQDPFGRYREMYHRFSGEDVVQAMLYTDISLILPDVYFEKVDRPAMANSIEVRVPMMDNDLVAYVLSLPAAQKIPHGKLKELLKTALRGTVPDKVLEAKKKGFSVPISAWLRGPLSEYIREVFTDDSIRHSALFDEQELMRRVRLHQTGKADYGLSLYKMLNLAMWYQRYMT